MRRFLAVLVSVMLATGSGLAQDAEVPVMGSTGSAGEGLPMEGEEDIVRILSVGDAVGGGLGAGLLRMGEIDGRYDVTIRFNEESGLARPELYDWPATLSKLLETASFDAIVVLMGANDRQTIRDGNARHAFGSPGWVDAYRRQLDRMLDVLKSSGARIYWVSIPPMADSGYDEAMRIISDLQKERVEARGASWVDIGPSFLTADGRFLETGPDETGEITRLRGRDGVSFFKQGNNVMGQLVLKALQSATPATMKTAAAVPQTRRQIARPPLVPREPRIVPLFGRIAADGSAEIVKPEDVTAGAALMLSAAGAALPAGEAMGLLVSIAQPGSAAERLFREGVAGDVPKGRADDFAAPVAASP